MWESRKNVMFFYINHKFGPKRFLYNAWISIFFFLHPHEKAFKVSWVARMGRNFDDYSGFQPMRSWANTYAQDCRSFGQKTSIAFKDTFK